MAQPLLQAFPVRDTAITPCVLGLCETAEPTSPPFPLPCPTRELSWGTKALSALLPSPKKFQCFLEVIMALVTDELLNHSTSTIPWFIQPFVRSSLNI